MNYETAWREDLLEKESLLWLHAYNCRVFFFFSWTWSRLGIASESFDREVKMSKHDDDGLETRKI